MTNKFYKPVQLWEFYENLEAQDGTPLFVDADSLKILKLVQNRQDLNKSKVYVGAFTDPNFPEDSNYVEAVFTFSGYCLEEWFDVLEERPAFEIYEEFQQSKKGNND